MSESEICVTLKMSNAQKRSLRDAHRVMVPPVYLSQICFLDIFLDIFLIFMVSHGFILFFLCFLMFFFVVDFFRYLTVFKIFILFL